ncbi:MAG TPA: twin-arginine translocase subunit TatC [Paenisporosarcina sp.]|nr:twin-arginine translocase subunit TatC [Paenisporosarcina sp.]
MEERDMTTVDHIIELRKRLMIIVVFFVVAVVISFFLAGPLIEFLQVSEEARDLTLNAFKITDPFKILITVMMVLAIVMTSPIILYQVWAFISPGLYKKERTATLSYIPFIFLLFIAGVSFSYYVVFPFVIHFMAELASDLNIEQTIGINEYFSFLFQLTIPFGFVFQMPVVLLFLTRLGIITPMLLTKYRKYIYLVLVVVADILTPPDIMSHVLVTIPLILLFEFSIIVAKIGYRKYLKAGALQQIEEAKRQNEGLPPE